MQSKNQYEYLKVDALLDEETISAAENFSERITDSQEESIIIHTAKLSHGYWIYGYAVYWANGRHSCQQPTATLGLFKTQREAELYAVGFMLLYVNYFTETTKDALRRAEHSLSQATLF